jgi:hypothetical protein
LTVIGKLVTKNAIGITLSLLRKSNKSGIGEGLESCQTSATVVESLIVNSKINGKSAVYTVLGERSLLTRKPYHIVKEPVIEERRYLVVRTLASAITIHARKTLRLISLESGIVGKWVSLFAHSRILIASKNERRRQADEYVKQTMESNIVTVFVFLLIGSGFSVICFLLETNFKVQSRCYHCSL